MNLLVYLAQDAEKTRQWSQKFSWNKSFTPINTKYMYVEIYVCE